MDVSLTKRDLDYIVTRVVKELRKQQQKTPEMVTTNEAARILGVTPQTMRLNQHKYPHIKSGEHKQGKLLFFRDALLNNY